ncbi:hypothetical protein [Streptomyces virginiae]
MATTYPTPPRNRTGPACHHTSLTPAAETMRLWEAYEDRGDLTPDEALAHRHNTAAKPSRRRHRTEQRVANYSTRS